MSKLHREWPIGAGYKQGCEQLLHIHPQQGLFDDARRSGDSPNLIEFTQRAVPAGYAFDEGAALLPEDVVPASQRRRKGKRTKSDMHDG